MPASKTEPNVGASTWASGNHIWNGGIGIFVEKPIKNSNQTIICWVAFISEYKTIYQFKLPTIEYKKKMPKRIIAEPNAVYIKK